MGKEAGLSMLQVEVLNNSRVHRNQANLNNLVYRQYLDSLNLYQEDSNSNRFRLNNSNFRANQA